MEEPVAEELQRIRQKFRRSFVCCVLLVVFMQAMYLGGSGSPVVLGLSLGYAAFACLLSGLYVLDSRRLKQSSTTGTTSA